MKLSNLMSAVVLALGTAGAQAAGGALDLSTGSAGFSSTPTAGGFLDVFTFTSAAAFTFSSSITSVVNGAQDVDFQSVFLVGPGGALSFSQLLADPVEVYALLTGMLAAGAYSISILGTNSPAIGSYAGNVAITPVPEPEIYAMLLAGLGAVGFMMRRRQSV